MERLTFKRRGLRHHSPVGKALIYLALDDDNYALRRLDPEVDLPNLWSVLILRRTGMKLFWVPLGHFQTRRAAEDAVHRHRRTGTVRRPKRRRKVKA